MALHPQVPERALVIAGMRCGAAVHAGLLHLLAQLQDSRMQVVLVLPAGSATHAPPGVCIGHAEAGATRHAWYGAGLRLLEATRGLAQIILCDDSFVALNPPHLLARSVAAAGALDIASLTATGAPEPVLQSEWLSLAVRPARGSADFLEWWCQGEAKSDAALTRHFRAAGYTLGSLLQLDHAEQLVAVCRAHACGALPPPSVLQDGFELDPSAAAHLDPWSFAWDKLMADFGAVSQRLVAENPARVNIAKLRRWVTQTPGAAALFARPQGQDPT